MYRIRFILYFFINGHLLKKVPHLITLITSVRLINQVIENPSVSRRRNTPLTASTNILIFILIELMLIDLKVDMAGLTKYASG